MAIKINVTYGSPLDQLPDGFVSGVNKAISFFEANISNPITVNISIDGGNAGAGNAGHSTYSRDEYSYKQIRDALVANPSGGAALAAFLPSTDPIAGSHMWLLSEANAKALGLDTTGFGTMLDGTVTISNALAWDYNPDDGIAPGSYDFVSAVEHEISEILGREAGNNQPDPFIAGGPLADSPLDLFRYASQGQLQSSIGGPAYFSLDGGATNLGAFNNAKRFPPGPDYADWAFNGDSFGFSAAGELGPVSATDLKVMQAIGYASPGASSGSQGGGTGASALQVHTLSQGVGGMFQTMSSGLQQKFESDNLPMLGKAGGGSQASTVSQGSGDSNQLAASVSIPDTTSIEQALVKIRSLQARISSALSALEDGQAHPASVIADAINGALAQEGFSGLAQVTLDQNNNLALTITAEGQNDFSVALDSSLGTGLANFSTSGTAHVSADYQLNLAASVDPNGNFSASAPAGPALSLGIDASAPQFSADAKLGFLNFTAVDQGSDLKGQFDVDTSGNVSASANAKLALQLGANAGGDFPSISADLSASWSLGATPTIAFGNVSVDFGSFVTHFVDPLLNRIDPILEPLHKLAAILNTDLTPLDPYAKYLDVVDANGNSGHDGKVTLVDLIQLADRLAGRHDNFSGLVQLANVVTQVTDWAAFLQGKSFGPDKYNLGSFTVDPTNLTPHVTAAAQDLTSFIDGLGGAYSQLTDPNNGGKTAAQTLEQIFTPTSSSSGDATIGASGGATFAFPILTNPLSVFGLLLGQDTSLFTFDVTGGVSLGSIDSLGNPTDTIPILTFPVFDSLGITVDAALSGALQAVVNIAGGYDTHGLSEFAASGFSNAADLANGFYLAAGNVLSLAASIEASLSASLGIPGVSLASLTGNANLTGTLTVDLAQKLHLDELPELSQLFTATGKITAGFGGALTLVGGWIPWSATSHRITLASWTGSLPGMSGELSGTSTSTTGAVTGPVTTFTVSSTSQFDSALATINSAPQQYANYVITVADGATVAIDDAFPGISLGTGSTLQIVDNGVIVFSASGAMTLDGPISGHGSIDVDGTGALTLGSTNTFTGGIRLDSGTVELGSAGADGGGPIVFAANAHARLVVDPGASPAGLISGFDQTDTILLSGINLTYANRDNDNVVTLTGDNGVTDVLQYDPGMDLTGLSQKPNGSGGTEIFLAQLNFTASTTAEFDAILSSINIGGDKALAGAPYKIVIAQGADVAVDASFPGLNLPTGATLKIIDQGVLEFASSTPATFDTAITDTGAVKIDAQANVTLTGDNSYSGGTVLAGGSLDLATATAAGTGAIRFASGVTSTLTIDGADLVANTIDGFVEGDRIDLKGVAAASAPLSGGNQLFLFDAAHNIVGNLQIDPTQDLNGEEFVAGTDGAGGTNLKLIRTNFDVSTTAQFDQAFNDIDIGGKSSSPGVDYKITILQGATVAIDGSFPGVNLLPTDTVKVLDKGALSYTSSADVQFTGAIDDAGSLDIAGGGVLTLTHSNSYAGGTTIEHGTLDVAVSNAAGSGGISFGSGSPGILKVEQGATVANTISGFYKSSEIYLAGVVAKGATLGANNVVTIDGANGPLATFNIDPTFNYDDYAFRTRRDGQNNATIVKVIKVNFTVGSEADWNDAVKQIDAGNEFGDTKYKITLTNNFTLSSDPEAIDLTNGNSLTIVGANHTIDGAGAYRGLFVYSGVVSAKDLTIANALARGGAGGTGAAGGGGGAGLGGGLFVAAAGDVTLSNVAFTNDAATGGKGGAADGYQFVTTTYHNPVTNTDTTSTSVIIPSGGGGGGLGGSGVTGAGGGVGNLATAANIPTQYNYWIGSDGIIGGAPAEVGGSLDGGGGNTNQGGGIYDATRQQYLYLAVGGFGGGGGSYAGYAPSTYDPYNYRYTLPYYFNAAGFGGFGGGGGGASNAGTSDGAGGGFGGGGGGGFGLRTVTIYDPSGYQYQAPASRGAVGGFGAGAGGQGDGAYNDATGGYSDAGGGGGGGAGLGGGIFVEAGGKLTLGGGSVAGGDVTGGAGGGGGSFSYNGGPAVTRTDGSAGSAFGAGVFFEGANTAILAPADGQTLVISDAIADETGSIPNNGSIYNYALNKAGLDVKGPGTVVLGATNTFTGGVTLEGGTLRLAAPGAGGGASIVLDAGVLDLAAPNALVGQARGSGQLTVNLPSTATIVAANMLPSVNGTSGFGSTDNIRFTVGDASGVIATLDVYFAKSADNTWDVAIYDDAAHNQSYPYNGSFFAGGPLAHATLAFDGAGNLTAGSAHALSFALPNGGQNVSLDISGMTQTAANFSVSNETINLAGTMLDFAPGSTATLVVEAGDAPTALISGFLPQGAITGAETIDLRGVGLETTVTLDADNVATISGGAGAPITLEFDPLTDMSGYHLALSDDHAGGTTVSITVNTTAGDAKSLNDILKRIDIGGLSSAPNTHYTITLTSDITLDRELDAINLASGDTLTIDGAGYTLHGGYQYRGLLDYAGDLTLKNLTISDAVARGGAGGGGGGGGGAGLGGGLFVGSNAKATLSGVTFINDQAIGGAGGGSPGNVNGGGGGGLGGAGTDAGGGGGVGISATGGGVFGFGGSPGILLGAASGASDPTDFYSTGGANGGGGYGGIQSAAGGGGAGASGETGGFGGGGAGGSGENAGAGGFGGGGGGVIGSGFSAGAGGFGGGGGGADAGSTPGAGGFDGGAGSIAQYGGGGGGGAGLGGAIFVASGGAIVFAGGGESSGSAVGGTGGFAGIIGAATSVGAAGQGAGAGVFAQGGSTIAFAPAVGQTLTIADAIADSPSGGGVSVEIGGAGTVVLSGQNTYTGATTVDAGATLSFGATGASGAGALIDNGEVDVAGTKPVVFAGPVTGTGRIVIAAGSIPTLVFDSGAPGVEIDGFGLGDALDLKSLAWEAGDTIAANGNQVQILDSANHVRASVTIAGATPASYTLSADASGGTVLSDGGVLTVVNETDTAVAGEFDFSFSGQALVGDSGGAGTELRVAEIADGSLGSYVVGQYGALNMSADGSYYYFAFGSTPATPGPYHDVFHYTVADAIGHTADATIDFTVLGRRLAASAAAANVYVISGARPSFVVTIVDSVANIQANLGALQPLVTSGRIAAFEVDDTAANLVANVSFLSSLHISGITLTDVAPPVLHLTVAQEQALAGIAGLITGDYFVDVVDTAAHVSASIDLLAHDAHLQSITLTDAGIPELVVTAAQATADAATLSTITNASYTIRTLAPDGSFSVQAFGSQAYHVTFASDGRPLSVVWPDGQTKTWTYAPDGSYEILLANVQGQPYTSDDAFYASNGAPLHEIVSNAQGALIEKTWNVDGTLDVLTSQIVGQDYTSQSVHYAADGTELSERRYNALGLLLSETFNADGSFEQHSYQIVGQSFTDSDVLYAANGKPLQASWSNGETTSWTYNADGSYEIVDANAPGKPFATDTVYAASGAPLDQKVSDARGVFQEKIWNADGTTNVITSDIVGQDYTSQNVHYAADGTELGELRYNALGLLLSETFNADGSFDEHSYQIAGQSFTDADVLYAADGKPLHASWSNGETISWTYNAGGSYEIVDANAPGKPYTTDTVYNASGAPLDQKVSDARGVFQEKIWNADGTTNVMTFDIVGQNYTSQNMHYAANGATLGFTQSNAQGLLFAETFNADGSIDEHSYQVAGKPWTDYNVHYGADGRLDSVAWSNGQSQTLSYNADGSRKVTVANVAGANYSSYQSLFTSGGSWIADAVDYLNGTGKLVLGPDGLTVSSSAAGESVTSGATTFALAAHPAGETIVATGSANDTFAFHAGSGAVTINGFAPSDYLQFDAAQFSDISKLSIQSSGGNTSISEGGADQITLAGAASVSQGQFRFV